MNKIIFSLVVILCMLPVGSAVAAKAINVDCSKKSLAAKLASLDKAKVNVVNVVGTCVEDLVIEGFKDLSLIGDGSTNLSATVFDPADQSLSTTALTVENSHLSLSSLTINSGAEGLRCFSRSVCNLEDVTVEGGHSGISYQHQSQGDIIGNSAIQNSLNIGIGIFGASSVNLRPEPFFNPGTGPIITGHGSGGVFMLDGSFLRMDGVSITNNGLGILARRNSIIKMFNGELSNNASVGLILTASSTAQLFTEILGNGGDGVALGTLSYATLAAATITGNTGLSVNCQDASVIADHLSGATLDSTNCP